MRFSRGVCVLLILACALPAAAYQRQRLLLDFNWRFTLNDPADAAAQFDYPEIKDLAKAHSTDPAREEALAQSRPDPIATNVGGKVSFVQSNFDDKSWQPLDLPHDWVVALPFDPRGDQSHGYKKIGPKLGNTIGWYRRRFHLPAEDKGHTLDIEFDGVYRNCLVWLNGHCLGRNVSGYSSFDFDISNLANFGDDNELVVRVDATRTEGWFYEGAGIYRHVWLVKTDPLHVAHWGTYVSSEVWGKNATITAVQTIQNDADHDEDCTVVSTVIDADGKPVAEGQSLMKVDSGDRRDAVSRFAVYDARLWSPDHPYLYTLMTQIKRDGNVVDSYQTPFGIRTIRFDPDQGFILNGQRVEIRGTCNHQDHAGVGAALPDRLQYFRIEKLKEMGANAYRSSHNDPTPELLDACDKLGMLVMDEHRQLGTDAEHLSQLARLVMRDRNHPSVVIWSIGNEEPIQGRDYGAAVASQMQAVVHALDPTRPCTEAMNNSIGQGLSKVIDVQGFNYRLGTEMDEFHHNFPQTPCIGTEEGSTISTRGIYQSDKTAGYLDAYDDNRPRWAKTAEHWWAEYLARPWLSGAFVWTGFDYRGEPTPYRWPSISSQFGILDTCGFPKDNFYYYQAWWSDKTVLHLLPHWNWAGKEGQDIDVWCYSNLPAVELFLNGQSFGKQAMLPNSHLEWKVPYSAGVLEARGFQGEHVVATTRVRTTGAAAKLILTPDRSDINADGQDVSIVTATVADADGLTVPTADDLIQFSVAGDARIIGVGNGNPSSLEPDKADQRKAFGGLCMALVQAGHHGGAIQVKATASGLAAATITLRATPGPALEEVQ